MSNDATQKLSHQDIARRFVQAEVFNFGAMGKLISELGSELAINDQGWHGVNFGRYNVLACMMPAADVARLVGSLRTASLAGAAIEGAIEASSPR